MLFMGIDAGTQGVRCIITDGTGGVVAAHSAAYKQINIASAPDLYEQSAEDWWSATAESVRSCVAALKDAGMSADMVSSVSVDGTSGTIVALDKEYTPLANALMYNDMRASVQAKTVRSAMGAHEKKLGFTFNASFSLPRILWIKDNRPDIYDQTAVFAHQADYIVGRLCGEYRVSDYSNALKTGYDLIDGRWPDAVKTQLNIDTGKLPRVVAPGSDIATVSDSTARELGLSPRMMVTGGSTDGYASALAAGAIATGSWASIIGTTFVLKGVTDRLIIDPNGSSYSHRLPSGEWMLGGASNIGGRCLNEFTPSLDFAAQDALAERLVPTGVYCYPLTGRGERFPFVDPRAEAFYIGNITGGRLYAALMEGVGFAERLTYDRMTDIGAPVGGRVFATGGACRSPLWLRIRASILNKALVVPDTAEAAMGSAMLAASGHFGSLSAAATAMLRVKRTVEPDMNLVGPYDEIYMNFKTECRRRYNMNAV